MTKRLLYIILLVATSAAMLGGQDVLAQAPSANALAGFLPLEHWKDAVLAGDAAAVKEFYSADPVAQVMANGVKTSADADVNFWLGLKARSMKLETVAVLDRPKGTSVVFKAVLELANGQTLSVTDGQMWRKQGEQWRVVSVESGCASSATADGHEQGYLSGECGCAGGDQRSRREGCRWT